MVKQWWLPGLAGLAIVCANVQAQGPTTPAAPQPAAPQPITASPEQLAQAPSTEAAPTPSAPNMLGDQMGFFFRRSSSVSGVFITFNGQTFFSPSGPSSSTPSSTSLLGDPIVIRGAFKGADNESAMPQDRVFTDYNFYNRVLGTPLDVNQEVIGFEKTFLDGNASFEMRLPFFQATNAPGLNQSDVGDLTMLLKYALYRDQLNAVSVGLAVTVPTGPDLITVAGNNVNDVLLQPYVGFLMNSETWFAQGFSELLVPTNSHDVTAWFNDLQVGYWLMDERNAGLVTNVAPVLEAHLTTPLDHRDSTSSSVVQVEDILDITAGALVELNHHSLLQVGVCTPITGPKPFAVEAIAQFNLRF